MVSRLFYKSRASQIKFLNKFFSSNKISNCKILLVGGGDGLDIQFFDKSFEITYLDSAKGMVNKAKSKFKLRKNTHFILSDFIRYTEITENKFDIICLHFCLASTSNTQLMLEKACGMLKSRGLLSILDVATAQKNIFSNTLNLFTKNTMFNIFNNIEKLCAKQNSLSLVYKKPLVESIKFNAYMYEKK